MPRFEFGEWLPDLPALRNPGVVQADNVIPGSAGYLPFHNLVAATDALDARPRGAASFRDADGIARVFAGDAGKLYENMSNTWTDRSKTGGYALGANDRWELVNWKNQVIGFAGTEDPQVLDFGASTFADLTTDFQAAHGARIGPFVVVGNTTDVTDGHVPYRVRWSAINDATDWTVDPVTRSGYNDLQHDSIERILGGEYGLVFQRSAVTRMDLVGGGPVWQFREVLPDVGLISPGAITQIGNVVFFASRLGFFELVGGTQVNPIGAQKVDRFFLNDLDIEHRSRMSAAVSKNGQRVLWSYPGDGNASGRPNRIIVYDRNTERWSLIRLEHELIYSAMGVGLDLDSFDASVTTDLDSLNISLDSERWKGQGEAIAGFTIDFKSGFFDGSPLQGVLSTREVELHRGRRTMLNAFRPIVDGGKVVANISSRNRQADSPTPFSGDLTLRDSGRITARVNARYHRFRFKVSDDFDNAIGWQIEPADAKASQVR